MPDNTPSKYLEDTLLSRFPVGTLRTFSPTSVIVRLNPGQKSPFPSCPPIGTFPRDLVVIAAHRASQATTGRFRIQTQFGEPHQCRPMAVRRAMITGSVSLLSTTRAKSARDSVNASARLHQ